MNSKFFQCRIFTDHTLQLWVLFYVELGVNITCCCFTRSEEKWHILYNITGNMSLVLNTASKDQYKEFWMKWPHLHSYQWSFRTYTVNYSNIVLFTETSCFVVIAMVFETFWNLGYSSTVYCRWIIKLRMASKYFSQKVSHPLCLKMTFEVKCEKLSRKYLSFSFDTSVLFKQRTLSCEI